jgi:hypothetical protein
VEEKRKKEEAAAGGGEEGRNVPHFFAGPPPYGRRQKRRHLYSLVAPLTSVSQDNDIIFAEMIQELGQLFSKCFLFLGRMFAPLPKKNHPGNVSRNSRNDSVK